MATPKPKVPVYSYLRFSTLDQQKGDSERRQTEPAIQWVNRPEHKAKGYYLVDQLADRGLSGYYGVHRTKGALGRFLHAVENNQIPRGSILLVENIDRLSREGAINTLREIIFKLWDYGIILQTLGPEETFAPGCAETPNFIGLIFSIQRAQAESKRKSDLIRESRKHALKEARESGKILTARCPEWLHKVSDYKFEPISSEAVKTIQLIFSWKLQGMSQYKIELRLNAEATWRPKMWHIGYIKKILSNRAVIGEYQPYRKVNKKREPTGDVIEGYYPVIVNRDVFYAVQKLLDTNKGKGGQTGKKRNIFTHIAQCAYCGGPMRFTDKGKTEWRYLVCDNAARGVSCKCYTVRYAEVQDLVLEGCRHLNPEQVLPSTEEKTTKINALLQRIKGEEAELQDIEERTKNLYDQIERTKTPEIRDGYENQIKKLYLRRDSLTVTLDKDQCDLNNAETSTKQFNCWKRVLAELMNVIANDDAAEIRAKLAIHLREFITRIEIFPVGFKNCLDLSDPSEWDIGELVMLKGNVVKRKNRPNRRKPGTKYLLPCLEMAPKELESFWAKTQIKATKTERAAFEKYVIKRRMSKEGRFYRIYFNNGERIDLVPPGGLATGLRVMKGSVEKLLPNFESLWVDFQKSRDKLFQHGQELRGNT